MLERTAATSIDKCNLQRILLPSAARHAAVKTSQRLRNGFWYHGAAGLDFAHACNALTRTPLADLHAPHIAGAPVPPPARARVHHSGARHVPPHRLEPILSAAFPLEFLCPASAQALGRKLFATALENRGPSRRFRRAGLCPHSSSFSSKQNGEDGTPSSPQDPDRAAAGAAPDVPPGPETPTSPDEDHQSPGDVDPPQEDSSVTPILEPPATSTDMHASSQDTSHPHSPTAGEEEEGSHIPIETSEDAAPAPRRPQTIDETAVVLRGLLASDRLPPFQDIWSLYGRLDAAGREGDFPLPILLKLEAIFDPTLHSQWVINLFRRIDAKDWTGPSVALAVRATLEQLGYPAAASICKMAMDQRGILEGLDVLLARLFELESWDELFDVLTFHSRFRRTGKCGLADDMVDDQLSASFTAPMGQSEILFHALSRVGDLDAKFKRLEDFFLGRDYMATDGFRVLADFLRLLVFTKESLQLFETPAAMFMLRRIEHPAAYMRFIYICLDRNQSDVALKLYLKFRNMDVEPSLRMLMSLRNLFPENRLVKKDWDRHRYGWNISTFYRTLKPFGVLPLLEEDPKVAWVPLRGQPHHPGVLGAAQIPTLRVTSHAPTDSIVTQAFLQIKAHGDCGEVSEARSIFQRAEERLGFVPPPRLWNALLRAHQIANDHSGMLNTFASMCERAVPDKFSYGTMMNMTGQRGDLDLTLALAQRAKAGGIAANFFMINAVIEAYCENERYREAENICVQTLGHIKTQVDGTPTILFNTILSHLARRRDLNGVNRLLQVMSELKVPHDHGTYDQLLLTLVNCKQAHHAMHLIRSLRAEAGFEPTKKHFLLLMAALIRTGESHLALRVNRTMALMGYPEDTERMSLVIRALGQWWTMNKQGDYMDYVPEINLHEAIRVFLRCAMDVGTNRSRGRLAEATLDSVFRHYSTVVHVLVQFRDFGTVTEILNLFMEQFPAYSTPDKMPMAVLDDMMRASLYEQQYDRVRQTWDVVVKRTLEAGAHRLHKKTVIPTYRYRLSAPLKTMQQMFLALEDPEGVMALVRRVQEMGFKLDNKNWNYYVQALCRLGRLREACEACERELMPRWAGWGHERSRKNMKNRLPLELRRVSRAPDYNRPISYTMLLLARALIDLDEGAMWSSTSSETLHAIQNACPRLCQAVKAASGYSVAWNVFAESDTFLSGSEAAGIKPRKEQRARPDEEEEREEKEGLTRSRPRQSRQKLLSRAPEKVRKVFTRQEIKQVRQMRPGRGGQGRLPRRPGRRVAQFSLAKIKAQMNIESSQGPRQRRQRPYPLSLDSVNRTLRPLEILKRDQRSWWRRLSTRYRQRLLQQHETDKLARERQAKRKRQAERKRQVEQERRAERKSKVAGSRQGSASKGTSGRKQEPIDEKKGLKRRDGKARNEKKGEKKQPSSKVKRKESVGGRERKPATDGVGPTSR